MRQAQTLDKISSPRIRLLIMIDKQNIPLYKTAINPQTLHTHARDTLHNYNFAGGPKEPPLLILFEHAIQHPSRSAHFSQNGAR